MYLWWGGPFLFAVQSSSAMNSVAVIGLLVFMVTFFAFIRFMPTISVPFICRVELSLVVAGCLVACLGDDEFISGVLVYAAIIVSQYLNLLYSARLFRSGFGGATFTFAVVQLINHTAGWIGDMLAVGLTTGGLLNPGTLPSMWCAICGIAFFAIATMRDTDSTLAVAAGDHTSKPETADVTTHLLKLAERYALTPRETEIFLLLAKGRSAPFIRDELTISLNTVTSHMRRIYRKMDLHTRQELLDLVNGETGGR